MEEKDDDYAAFPRLDPDVESTLVPSLPVIYDEPGSLPDEVYERLEYLYGFAAFNRQLEDEISDRTTSNSLRELFATRDSNEERDMVFPAVPEVGLSPEGPSTQNMASLVNLLPSFTEFRVLHMDPLVLAIDDFFTHAECDRYVDMSLQGSSAGTTLQSQSPTVGKDASSRSQRTSTTWYHYYKNAPELIAKATKLMGLSSMHQWEEPQTVRYRRSERFTWHLDALGPAEIRPSKGGQRIATLLVYLTDLATGDGGATMFRDLKSPVGDRLAVVPRKGSALLFFPAAGGIDNVPFDIRTLHCGQAISERAQNDKWIAQLWLCEKNYTPTAPDATNSHTSALKAIVEYCRCFGI